MEIVYVAGLVLIASTAGTVSGFGISTIMVPIMLLFTPWGQTLLFVGIIHWFNDIWKIMLFRKGLNWQLIAGFGIPGIIASFLGASLTLKISKELLTAILGGFLVAYSIFIFLNPKFRMAKSKRNMIAGGSLSGFFAGIFGIFGAINAAFLTAFDQPKEVYFATAGTIALLIDSSRLVTYIKQGVGLESKLLWGMIAFVPISFIGAGIAKRIVGYIPQKSFRLVITILLGLLGIYFLIKNIWQIR